ncbi:hypothetical protein [Thalassomonas haliotis]|uniref:Flagellar hook-length control protein-like C-terminal domain-containing protein n=1 Tax=Thalassomonas haliotis TaxID=485448 RepID=A0ABY7V6Z5_9GAMM|nr:hypothetical protein [Thalassomonas haliotis]WDE09448.1 hypothetical protein H3N35_13980 [Thalassomonas haliotis]
MMIKQADKLSSFNPNAGEMRSGNDSPHKKLNQANSGDEKKLRALLERGEKGEKAESFNGRGLFDETKSGLDAMPLDIQSRLFQQSLAKSPELQSAPKANTQAWTEYVVNKVQSNLPNLQNTSINISLPVEQLNGTNIVLSRDAQGALSVSFMVGSLAVADQLQKDLPQLRKALEKKLPGSKINLEIKQEIALHRERQPQEDELEQVYR